MAIKKEERKREKGERGRGSRKERGEMRWLQKEGKPAVTRERGSRNDSIKKMRERANIVWGKRVTRKRKTRMKEANILDIREEGNNERDLES